ncbi:MULTISPECIES: outer membrane protein assembly factor BamD [Methylobacterium]|uniref:Outer membrane protein assembly factor BamD n=4 Tax=Pseudomonadota TaxID=1224 RepID=A0ABQ4T0M2_9HYPH|nr:MULTISPECIES: outer membrane protein assembly factor BamD [Methylobacterium]PIU06588.1 MAG: outer membrane protein assembly factor BamD [Methylobacterium sp. CG09_land_8_20_14_0_10_71_15]PIU12605.1 MAG: outer membrane protein assembly factor BamD [Methylobacterium sp. CG08_land_8_20_14_0_20_71_15]GBU19852.1 outer membrane protein assembly factor BamD [Methylobacterium sp.]GJE08026.1 Outer membrane protein assembly factor BamD [Methylobacterium jeotgali]
MSVSNPTRGAMAAVILSVLGLGLGGCDALDSINPFAEKYKPEVIPTVPADKLYSEGLAKMEDSDYEGAAKKFGDLDKQYTYSDWSRKALLMTAFANYEGQKYDDAINASKRYLQRHPASKDAAYAQYLMAMSQYKQIPDVTRDQERSERALVALQELVTKYPKSEYVADAKAKIQITRDQLAGKEMEIGRYYLERRNFPAAINRFRDVVSKYQTTRHAEEALMRLTEAYMALGITAEAQNSAAVLGHNFPDSPWYKDAYALLQNGGLEPREEKSSFLSRAFRSITGQTASAN